MQYTYTVRPISVHEKNFDSGSNVRIMSVLKVCNPSHNYELHTVGI